MAKRAPVASGPTPLTETCSIGGFEFTSTGVTVHGHPTRAEWEGVFDFVSCANKYSGFWMVDLIAYVDSREDWADWRDHVISAETGLTFSSVQVYRSIGKSVPAANRVDDVAFGHHMAVAPLASDEQVAWLEKSKEQGWTKTELVAEIRAAKRVKR